MRSGAGVALDPSGHLALKIAIGLAGFRESDGWVIQSMQWSQVIDEALAEPARRLRRKLQPWRWISPDNDSMQLFHEIKRGAYDGFIIAVKKYCWHERIRIVKLREDTKLTTHIMS